MRMSQVKFHRVGINWTERIKAYREFGRAKSFMWTLIGRRGDGERYKLVRLHGPDPSFLTKYTRFHWMMKSKCPE